MAGKGGSGRTTVAAALAAQAAARGRRVLAIDAVGTGDLERVVAERASFETLRLTTAEAIDQYLRIYLRLPIGPRRLGPLGGVFDYVAAAAPGVREILVIGKIGWEVRHGGWDEVIVDGPATGHVVELLDAPRAMAKLVPTGPLAEQTGWLREVLASDRSEVVVVSGPDELSVSESRELIDRLAAETEIPVRRVVANRQPPPLGPDGRAEAGGLTEGGGPLAGLTALILHHHLVAQVGIERLTAGGCPVVEVPDQPGDPVAAVVEALDPTGHRLVVGSRQGTGEVGTVRHRARPGSTLHGNVEALDRVLAERRVIVVVGQGGVGKTTMAAAAGLRAARRHGRRVVVVTVDPARRLAEALGVARLTDEAILVPAGDQGRMWALMIDMAKSWDRVVEATAPDPETASRILANRLYRTLTRRFIQSHDYIALDHLVSLGPAGVGAASHGPVGSDLVIVDTPPSRHAIDLIDAPGRMVEFFDGRLLRWLTAGAGSGLGRAAARPFVAVAERLLGGRFLAEIVELFTLFSELRPAFAERSRQVEAQLGSPDTAYLVVSSADPSAVDGCDDLVAGLEERGRVPDVVVVNRLLPGLRLSPAGPGVELEVGVEAEAAPSIVDPLLAAAIDAMLARVRVAELPAAAATTPTVGVEAVAGDLTSIPALAGLLPDP